MISINHLLLAAGFLAAGGGSAYADTFTVKIDTTSLSGTGGIYFQFNPGLNSDPASVVITNFVISGSGALIPLPTTPIGSLPAGTDGDVTGSLDSPPLTLANTQALNDYLQYLTFGDSLQFQLTFNLPPKFDQSPSSFGLEVTNADGLSSPFDTDANLFNVEMTFDSSGRLQIANTASQIDVAPAGVPEPGSVVLLFTAIGAVLLRKRFVTAA